MFESLSFARGLMARFISLVRALRPMYRRTGFGVVSCSVAVCTALLLAACGDLVGNPDLPAGTEDPATYNTPEGALAQALAAQNILQNELVDYTLATGLLTDELTTHTLATDPENTFDTRTLSEGSIYPTMVADQDYNNLQQIRGQARQARGMVVAYAPAVSPAVRAKLYAEEAYADILLADLFCSGVPLSTLDFEKDFTYKSSSSTAAVYEQAKALLDTALPLAADSPRVQTLVQVLQGRALLALGQYDQAAAAVASVPDGSTYQLKVAFVSGIDRFAYWSNHANTWSTVADGDGQNGLHYIVSGDPRTATTQLTVNISSGYRTIDYPNKYNGYTSTQLRHDTVSNNLTDSVMFTTADWIEARLIQAEAALHAGDIQTWTNTLNTLRANAGATLSPAIGPIPPLSSDSTTNASATLRIDVLFHERAFWLFLTGHRNGDLRRLIRNYGRDQSQVYPTGSYLGGQSSTGAYGTDVNAPIPTNESINPLFHGCLDRDA